MKLRYMIPLIAFLALALLLGLGLRLNPEKLPSTLIGKPAPAFSLNLLSNNQPFTPEQLKGKRWLLNIWASWCVSCKVEHPLLNQLAANTDIILVGLNYKDTPEKAKAWLAERGNPYDYVPQDIAGTAGIDWGVYGVPETFVIDEQGIVIYKHTGPVDVAALQDDILPLLSKSGEAE